MQVSRTDGLDLKPSHRLADINGWTIRPVYIILNHEVEGHEHEGKLFAQFNDAANFVKKIPSQRQSPEDFKLVSQ